MTGNKDYFCGDGVEVALPLFQTDSDGSIPISPLQLKIEEIGFEIAGSLCKKWHSRLPIITNPYSKNTICFIAIFENVYYASAIWSDPIARAFNGKNYLELRRFAISPNAPPNTATRMISIMTKMICKLRSNIVKLISYQDTEVHKGTIYKASGWVNSGERRYSSWTHQTRKRNVDQATGNKIRWEKDLKALPNVQK